MPPLVLLHGFPFDATLWAEVRALLPADRLVLAPNLPGFGDEPALAQPSMEALADWLAQWLTARGYARAAVVGHSLGGYVALAFAARHPARLAALGLLHSTASPDTPEKRASRQEQIAFLTSKPVARLVPNLIRPLVAAAHAARLQKRLSEFVDKAAALPAATLQHVIGALRDRPDQRPLLPTLPVPVLYLAGRHDPMFDPVAAREQATAASTALATFLDECGHLGMLEQPEAVAFAINQLVDNMLLREGSPG